MEDFIVTKSLTGEGDRKYFRSEKHLVRIVICLYDNKEDQTCFGSGVGVGFGNWGKTEGRVQGKNRKENVEFS